MMSTNSASTNLFDAIDSATMTTRLPKLADGTYTVEITKTTSFKSNNPATKGKEYAVAEVKVVDASEGALTPKGGSAVISLGSTRAGFGADLVGMISAASKLTDPKMIKEKVTKEVATAFFSDDPKSQASVKGKTFRVTVSNATSKLGNAFYKYVFSPA